MNRRRLLGGGLLAICLVGCSSAPIRGGSLPPPNNTYTLGPGDRFELTVIGENFPKEYSVASDGTVDLPMLHRQNVAGFEAQDLASHLRQLLIDGKFLRDPVVIVNIKEFNSKRITVGGAVSKPGDYPYTPGLSLLRVISNAGGFTAVANRTAVLITRRSGDGQRFTASFSVDAISEGRTSDVPLQAGDNVYVNERNF